MITKLLDSQSFSKAWKSEVRLTFCAVDSRHLKIPGRDELGRLPEVNLLNRACARELSAHLSAVLVSSRTPFRPTSRRIENVSSLLLFCPGKCSNRPYFHLY